MADMYAFYDLHVRLMLFMTYMYALYVTRQVRKRAALCAACPQASTG
jgi:hypothetical protein